jgi:hypothetical protein
MAGSMIHSVSNTDHAAAPWSVTRRWADWLGRAGAVVVHHGWRLWGSANAAPDMWMSREWLDEYERRSPKHPEAT